ncbi:hypothetical protein CDCA_CDCA09G2735 [Cyanidium caldarium]|uniref:UBX domain-containing protein n=1 Tax=Cyanidium caldarium TaxID=2771 RepID=A0AAV9IX73_CYACA|nr:hypothetical protein CDCA_CDCA09G2735 [Cyanidium caldarium]
MVQLQFDLSAVSRGGVRQRVEVGPGTLISEALAQAVRAACRGNSDQWPGAGCVPEVSELAVRHGGRVVDLSLPFRLSGLSANARLEVVWRRAAPHGTTRTAAAGPGVRTVRVAVQFGGKAGERIEVTAALDQTLWQVLSAADGAYLWSLRPRRLTARYLNVERVGVRAMCATRLMELGLAGGARALIRVEAHESAEDVEGWEAVREVDGTWSASPSVANATAPAVENGSASTLAVVRRNDARGAQQSDPVGALGEKTETPQAVAGTATPSMPRPTSNAVQSTADATTEHPAREVRPFRVYRPSESSVYSSKLDLPEAFYELTPEELRALLAERQVRREEERTLRLRHSRPPSQNIATTATTTATSPCLIRVRMPDRVVLEGTFAADETAEDVYVFVRAHLRTPLTHASDFELHQARPRRVIQRCNGRLEALGLAPASLLHFRLRHQEGELAAEASNGSYLSEETLSRMEASPWELRFQNEVAAAAQCRGHAGEQEEETATAAAAAESIATHTSVADKSAADSSNSTPRMPKWFRR